MIYTGGKQPVSVVGYATAPQHPNNSQALLQTQIWEETWQKACSVYLRRKFPLTRLQFTLQSSLSVHEISDETKPKPMLKDCTHAFTPSCASTASGYPVHVTRPRPVWNNLSIQHTRCGLSTTCPTLLICPLFHCTLSASSQCHP